MAGIPEPPPAAHPVAEFYARRWREHPIEQAYTSLACAQRQALIRHLLVCLASGEIHPDDLADWVTSYHTRNHRQRLLAEMPVTKAGLRLAEEGHRGDAS